MSALGLAALVALSGSGGAKADIIISQTTVQPTGDPIWEYDFQISLTPGTLMQNGDFITLKDVPDADPTINPQYVFIIQTTQGPVDISAYCTPSYVPDNGGLDVKLEFTYSTPPFDFYNPTTATSNYSIGDLYVATTYQSTTPLDTTPLLNPISYTYQSHSGTDPGQVTIPGPGLLPVTTPQALVPEPASLAMTLVGAGMAAAWLRSRGRDAARRA